MTYLRHIPLLTLIETLLGNTYHLLVCLCDYMFNIHLPTTL